MAQSSSEIIDKLAKQPVHIKLAILVGVLLALTGGYYYFFYSDMSAEQDSLAATKKKLSDDERRLLKRKTDYQELLTKKKDVESRLQKNAVKLPESRELPAFYQHLETQAAAANVRIMSRAYDKEAPIESYIRVPVKLEVRGEFYQINHYLVLLSETSRIITIDSLQLTDPARDGEKLVMTAKFTASTFRQADRPAGQAPPPPAVDAAGSAPSAVPTSPTLPTLPTPSTPVPSSAPRPRAPAPTPAATPAPAPAKPASSGGK